MASTKTKVKPIRISNESAEYFEGKPLNRMVESLYEHLKGGKITFDGESLKAESVYTEKNEKKSEASPNNDLKEIESMANFFGISLDEFLKMVCEGLTEGVLTIEKGKIVGTPDLDLENFKEACHETGADPQKVLDKATQGVRRGTL